MQRGSARSGNGQLWNQTAGVFLSPEPSNNLFAVLPWASYIAFLCLISFSRVKDPGRLRIGCGIQHSP